MTSVVLIIVAGLFWYVWVVSRKPRKPIKPTPTQADGDFIVTFTVEATQEETPPIDKDAWEDWDQDLYGPGQRVRQLNGVRLRIDFTDREGKRTERDVTSFRYSYNPESKTGVLYAYCHMRNGNRPFALNRISKAVDLETGEIIQDVGKFLEDAFERTPSFAVEQFLAQHDAGLFVLFSFAKADGAMRAKERAILLGWAQSMGLKEPGALSELESKVRDWYLTKSAFWDAVKSVNKAPRTADYMNTLWQAAVDIVSSDKKPHDQEKEFLRYAAKKWGISSKDVSCLTD